MISSVSTIEHISSSKKLSETFKRTLSRLYELTSPKDNFFKLQNSYNLEKVTRIFFNQRRKMIKKPFNQLFSGNVNISTKLNIDLNLRPQNLNYETYYMLANEYEKLRG